MKRPSFRRPSPSASSVRPGGTRLCVGVVASVFALATAPVIVGGGPTFGLPEAAAHDAMVGATPEQDSTVTEAPQSIELEFSGIPRDEFNTVALSQDGEVLLTEEPTVDGHMLTVDVPADLALDDGEYTVGYQITSSDGHATRGSYTFTLSADGPATTDAGGSPDTADTADSGSAMPSWAGPVLGIAGVIVVLGALVVAVARFRAMSSREPDADDGRAGGDRSS
ncbi:copper resistance CopC family protein [Corynebacterium sp.]|uniref:copper resistance CopC family protein n=1 Tax=Corynebacterium sp. TaxID=1720 RepID=UPI003B3AFE81